MIKPFLTVLFLITVFFAADPASAQTQSCTSVNVGATQDITAFGVCKRVTVNSVPSPTAGVASVCVPTNIDAAQWASFYNNPPAGTTAVDCPPAGPCGTGGWYYSLNKACYYTNSAATQSCDTTCASFGGCHANFTKDIGSDNSDASRCATVATGLAGASVAATGYGSGDAGCFMTNYKGGWTAGNYYGSLTTCASASIIGRICACNQGSGCALPWGGNIDHGASVTAYQTPSGTCTSQTRTCTNGSLSGSYTNQSCTPGGSTCTGSGHTAYNGYCYYQVLGNQSCDTYCATRGGCNLAGTQAATASTGACQNTANAIGMYYDYGPGQDASGIGCYVLRQYYDPTPSVRNGDEEVWFDLIRSTSTTCASAPGLQNRKVCACNN